VSQPVAVVLQTARGAESPMTARVPSGKSLHLQLDLVELPALPAYRLEIVDSRGRGVWESTDRPNDGRLSVTVQTRLPKGTYWVRLYSSGPETELLREFELRVE
jgi:hypothetical protein